MNSLTCWCIKKRRSLSIFPALLGAGGIVLATYNVTVPWNLPVVLWIIALIVPLILGMMEYIRFRWVLLWELVMLLPIGLIILFFFGSAIVGLFRK